MKVSGKTLVITDPCYIAKDDDWGESTGFDYENYCIMCPEFTEYEFSDSGYGDGSPTVIEVPRKVVEITEYIDDLSKAYKEDDQDKISKLMDGQKQIGRFCMDSGCMCVLCLDEIKKYNPDCFNDLRSWCYCVINNFTGTVQSYEDEDGCNHFILTPDDPDKPYIVTE